MLFFSHPDRVGMGKKEKSLCALCASVVRKISKTDYTADERALLWSPAQFPPSVQLVCWLAMSRVP